MRCFLLPRPDPDALSPFALTRIASYEDGDREDLNGEEMDRVIETYDMLTDK